MGEDQDAEGREASTKPAAAIVLPDASGGRSGTGERRRDPRRRMGSSSTLRPRARRLRRPRPRPPARRDRARRRLPPLPFSSSSTWRWFAAISSVSIPASASIWCFAARCRRRSSAVWTERTRSSPSRKPKRTFQRDEGVAAAGLDLGRCLVQRGPASGPGRSASAGSSPDGGRARRPSPVRGARRPSSLRRVRRLCRLSIASDIRAARRTRVLPVRIQRVRVLPPEPGPRGPQQHHGPPGAPERVPVRSEAVKPGVSGVPPRARARTRPSRPGVA